MSDFPQEKQKVCHIQSGPLEYITYSGRAHGPAEGCVQSSLQLLLFVFPIERVLNNGSQFSAEMRFPKYRVWSEA